MQTTAKGIEATRMTAARMTAAQRSAAQITERRAMATIRTSSRAASACGNAAVVLLAAAAAAALPRAASAAPVGEVQETLAAAMERAPATIIASVGEVWREGHAERARLTVEAVLARGVAEVDAGSGSGKDGARDDGSSGGRGLLAGLAAGALVETRIDARLDHAVRLDAGSRALIFLGDLGVASDGGALVPFAALPLDGPDAAALEAAARALGAALALPAGEARDAALAREHARQLDEAPADLARDAAVELVRHERLRLRLDADARQRAVLRLHDEANRSPAKLALIELAATLREPGASDALVRSLGEPEADAVQRLTRLALAHLADPALGAKLAAALSGARAPEGRAALALTLAELRLGGAYEAIAPLLDDPDERARLGAVEALGALADPRARAALERASAEDARPAVRAAAASAARAAARR